VVGKAILITGCDSGFGHSLALHCHRQLKMTVLAACYKPGGDDAGAQRLARKSDGGIRVLDLDVTSEESVKRCLSQTQQILAGDKELWCVVNNAATLVFAEAEWQTRDMVSKQMDVNVTGALMVTNAFLPLLRRTQGRVINMISFCTDCPLPTLAVYTASKVCNTSFVFLLMLVHYRLP